MNDNIEIIDEELINKKIEEYREMAKTPPPIEIVEIVIEKPPE